MEKICSIIKKHWDTILNLILKSLEKKNKETELPVLTVTPNEEKLTKIVFDNLGIDPTPDDKVPDDVACAETMSTLIKKLFPEFPILSSTRDLNLELFMNKKFKREPEPKKGRIIISPRNANTFGHVGFFISDDKIASNSSKSGLLVDNYTWDSWIKEMKIKRNLSIFIYSVV